MAARGARETLHAVGLGKDKQKRSIKVADAVRNELAVFMLQKVQDPRLDPVQISRVEVTDDLKYAKIYYTVHGDETICRAAELGLQRAKGFFRSHLAATLNMRYTPELQFHYDAIEKEVVKMERLFQEIAEERQSDEKNPREHQNDDQ